MYTEPTGGIALEQFIKPFSGFNGTNLYVEGIAPGSNTLSWSYSGQSDCVDVIKATVLKVELDVENTLRTLMETNTLTAMVTPLNGLSVSEYTFEIKRDGSPTWYSLYQGPQLSFEAVAKVAGQFDLRVSASVAGVTCVSQEKDVEAQFPGDSDILAGQGVHSRMDQAWANTKNATTPTSRREEGYYITLDTSSGSYGITVHTIAPSVANNQGASWNTATFPRPPDSIVNPAPLEQPTYIIGWFHTHTPTTYRSVGRGVGPSGADSGWSANASINIPGYAYDYTESPAGSGSIPAAHPINSAAQIYTITPPIRRPTP
ncbi:MAG: hypothetical protein LBN38_01075 [Verrucomicrobiota bacterium]|jgi:hypothetical protein|nr:hypothetical protein [Verrucomicrobiota bacterium]